MSDQVRQATFVITGVCQGHIVLISHKKYVLRAWTLKK